MLCAVRQIRLTRYVVPAARRVVVAGQQDESRWMKLKGEDQHWQRWASFSSSSSSSSSFSQSDLPRLPVPALQSTMDKYLAAVRPLVSEQEFSETEKIVQEFIKSPGPDLQKILEKRAQEETNWHGDLSEWWKNVAYLDYRLPVVVNFNPGVVFPRQNYRGEEERLRFAAKFIAGVLDYKIMIDEETLPVDTLGGKPLCMSQYYQILSACRIPGLKKDQHVIFPGNRPDAPKHITVFHNNHMFTVEVYGSRGKPLNEGQLVNQLQRVMDQSQHPAPPVGLFTTMDRDSWATVYNDLTKNKKNKAAMQDVQRSIFALCLDKPMAGSNAPFSKALSASQMLHGGGAHLNSGNRWFDKTLQFIIGTDGSCGLNYEHTSAEGPPVVGIVDYVLDYVQGKGEGSLPAADVVSPRRLDVQLTAKAKEALQLADQEMAALVQDIQMTVFDFEDYGKEFIKTCRLSPDAFIQVAFQLTFYRLFKKPCATYESGSLRQFQLGRTDTIRSCSVDSHAFTQAMDNPSMPPTAKVALLQQAVKAHRNYTNQVVSGQGIDRHLLGLKLAALESGHNIPAIHLDTSFSQSTYFRVSTSQVGAKHDSVLCFGPVVPDGFGVCYNPQKHHLVFAISAFHMCSETDSDQFANVLRGSLLDMQKLLKQAPAENLG